MTIQQILSRTRLRHLALLTVSVLSVAATVSAATTHHRATHHTQHPSAAAPVILSAHPGTQLDIDARKLNSDDLEDAAKHHDHPVVLVGSAPLSSGKNDEALFVQLQSARLCGSAGCTTSVYLRHNDSWNTVLAL
ncbi:hypothetical protein [Gluconobacter thailandicus]|uniref:hypothetical protein n=1 Tax=Gluconobacter thailandicus TaxID=257438 RepID=UPI001F446572|nr:hypothetical protein [Gluconobacter thailandicus]